MSPGLVVNPGPVVNGGLVKPALVPPPMRLIDRLAAPLDDMLQILVEEAGIGIAIIGTDGAIVRVNGSLRRMVHPACDVAPGCQFTAIFCDDSEARQQLWAEIAPALEGTHPQQAFITMLHPRDGTSPTVSVSAAPLREADGKVSGAILQVSDISAQRLLEAQLAQGQKLQAVGQLAAGIAHDFNNLLTAMIGAADELLARGPSDQTTVEDLNQIRTSAERGADLVRQLLAFGRQQALQPCIVAANSAVLNLSVLLRRLLGSKIDLVLELEAPGRMVRVDPTQLDQVLINLAVNARDAMPEGGRLTLHTGTITLFRQLLRGAETIPPGSYVMIEVRDTGLGIPPDVLPRIFDPFFTTRREIGGSGLGLSTVHGIVRQSGGYLAVDSTVGQGTRFRIYLPSHEASVDAAAITAEAPSAALPAPAAGRMVLLVDDEDGVRRLTARALTNRGWAVLQADSAEAALALLDDDPARLAALCCVVSDVVMPGMGGAALVGAIRGRRQGVPAILASGYAEDAVRGELPQDVLFMAKPYTLRKMLEAVEQRALAAKPSTERAKSLIRS